MSIAQPFFTELARDEAYTSYSDTTGTPADALTSLNLSEKAHWQHAIDALLTWKSNPAQFEPADRPDQDVLESAIDFAVDELTADNPAPASIVPSGSGRIAMEWADGPYTVVVEFLDAGIATITAFDGHRVQMTGRLLRNPKTRKLELGG